MYEQEAMNLHAYDVIETA